MGPKIEISSLSISKLKGGIPFEKYNIDVSIDEIENNELGIKLKYKFAILSNPINAKISIEGITSIQGNENEVAKYLEPDEKNIPMIVNITYQEILPLLYVITRSIDIPCPAYKISQISQAQPQAQAQQQTIQEEPQVSTKQVEKETAEIEKDGEPSSQVQTEQQPAEDPSTVLDELEKLVEEQNVSSN